MSQCTELTEIGDVPSEAKWNAVFSLSFSVICLVTAELLPISLLTPIASALEISEGIAGQAVSATSIVGMVASLFIAAATRRIDRRLVLLMFTVLFIVSNALVSAASNYSLLLVGRMILGIALGGFWSMAAAVSMRLVPISQIPKALSIVFGGVSIAMAIAAPVGTYLGGIIGWRGVFVSATALGIVSLIWQCRVLPNMKPQGQASLGSLFSLLKRPQIGLGMLGMILVFGGHFAFFTYLRPFLETVSGFGINGVSSLLLGFGIANIVGTYFSGSMLRKSLLFTLSMVPLVMSILAFALVAMGHVSVIVATLIIVWGFLYGVVPVAWTTWLTTAIPDETESGGGLQVAAIQLAITVGAVFGGILWDDNGAFGAIIGSGSTLIFAAVLIFSGLRSHLPN